MRKKLTSIIMTFAMVVTMIPIAVFASGNAPQYDVENNVYYANGHNLDITKGDNVNSIIIEADGSSPVMVNEDTVIYLGMKNKAFKSDTSIGVNIMGAQVGKLYTGGDNGKMDAHVNITVDSSEGVNGSIKSLNVDNTNSIELWLFDADIKRDTVKGNLDNVLKAYCSKTATSDNIDKKSLLQANGLKESQVAYMVEFIYDTCGGGKIFLNGIGYDKLSGIGIEEYSIREGLAYVGHSSEDIDSFLEPTANEGKTFAGWFTDPGYLEGSELYLEDLTKNQFTYNAVTDEMITLMDWDSNGEINLYAKWEGKKADVGIVEDSSPVDNACSGALSNTSDELKDKVLTESDLKALEDGKDVDVWIEAKDISDNVDSSDKEKVESKIGNNKIAMYFDLTLWKHIEDASKTSVTETNGEVTISLVVPDEFINNNVQRSYSMIRVHADAVDIIPCTFDPETKKVSFKTDKFSTYALVYEDKKDMDSSPDSGDRSNMMIWAIFCLAALSVSVCTCMARRTEK